MAGRDVIVVGASSGGVETLTAIVSGLPKDLDAFLFVVLHVPSRSESLLPQILTRAGNLRAEHAKDNEPVQKGRIYIAPPDFQLEEGDLLRFRCRVGHAFGAKGLLTTQSESVDDALWPAFRALEENAALARRLAARARQRQRMNSAKLFEKRAKEAERQATVIRKALLSEKNELPVDPPNKA